MDLYGISPAAISSATGVSIRTAAKWKLRDGFLWSPEGERFAPGHILALMYKAQLADELERKLALPQQHCLF